MIIETKFDSFWTDQVENATVKSLSSIVASDYRMVHSFAMLDYSEKGRRNRRRRRYQRARRTFPGSSDGGGSDTVNSILVAAKQCPKIIIAAIEERKSCDRREEKYPVPSR